MKTEANRGWSQAVLSFGSTHPALLIGSLAIIFNLGLSLSGFYNWNFDSWSHMFFATHYMNSWFDTYDPRWFGGFSVVSYPPLVTQLLALGAFAIGLENFYVFLSYAVMISIPIAVFLFSSNFLSRQQAILAGLLAIILPALYLSNYTYGQLPTMFALATCLFMGYFLWRYLEEGRVAYVLSSSLLAGITAASHHFTILCLVPVIVAVTFVGVLMSRRNTGQLLKRSALFAVISLPLVVVPIWPFWNYVLTAVPQTPIFHLSRINLFTDGQALLQFLVAPYLMFLLALPLIVLAGCKNRILIPLAAGVGLLFVLGLGGTTPLPRWIFGEWWEWLTYDRFALWAGVLLLPLLASVLPKISFTLSRKMAGWFIPVLVVPVILVQLVACAFLGAEPTRQSFLHTPPAIDVAPLKEFLETPDARQYLYITLGFGEAQMEKLTTLTEARSLDGVWVSARTLPVLTESGVGLIDTSKFSDPELKTLGKILGNAETYHLKWVLVNDLFYDDILKEHGFTLLFSDEISRDSRLGAVTIWGKDGVPPITHDDASEAGLASILWGVAPLLLVVGFLVNLAASRYASRHGRVGESVPLRFIEDHVGGTIR